MASTELIREKEALLLSEKVHDTRRNVEFDSETDAKDNKDDVAPTLPAAQDGALPDLRFNAPTPSPFKRAALIVFTIILFWAAFNLRMGLWKNNRGANVIYASRYSKEHKFRPAASPIVTETLKDGRVRIRGAAPTVAPVQTPTPILKKANRKKMRKGKVPGKKDGRSKARK